MANFEHTVKISASKSTFLFSKNVKTILILLFGYLKRLHVEFSPKLFLVWKKIKIFKILTAILYGKFKRSTYFDENITFVLSKDQSFRIQCTLMNPAQFFILVTYLVLQILLCNF
jgi:hypothetical protein